MSKFNRSDDRHSAHRDEQPESLSKDEDANETYRDYAENERTLLRSRAQLSLSEVEKLLDQEHNDKEKRGKIESAIEDLERVVDCMADESLTSISAQALETEGWLEYDELRYEHSVSGNMPMLLNAFVVLVENDITPGRWILAPLAEAFNSILEERQPEMVALRLGLQTRVSGSTSPFDVFDRQLEGRQINVDMKTLIEEFGVSKTKAAYAVIEKYGLKHAAKTLVNRYESKTKFPDLVRKALDKHSAELKRFSTTWLSAYAAQDFLNSFPAAAQKYLKKATPPKT